MCLLAPLIKEMTLQVFLVWLWEFFGSKLAFFPSFTWLSFFSLTVLAKLNKLCIIHLTFEAGIMSFLVELKVAWYSITMTWLWLQNLWYSKQALASPKQPPTHTQSTQVLQYLIYFYTFSRDCYPKHVHQHECLLVIDLVILVLLAPCSASPATLTQRHKMFVRLMIQNFARFSKHALLQHAFIWLIFNRQKIYYRVCSKNLFSIFNSHWSSNWWYGHR